MSAPELSDQNLNIGGVLGLAMATFRRHWLSLVLVALVPILAGEIFGVWLPAQLTGILGLPLVGMVGALASSTVAAALYMRLVQIRDGGHGASTAEVSPDL